MGLGGPRHRWEDNIRIDLEENRCEYDDGRALANTALNLRVP